MQSYGGLHGNYGWLNGNLGLMDAKGKKPMARSVSVGSVINMRCLACGTTKTPLWRPGPGPKGNKFLCNACGIRYHKELRKNKGEKLVGETRVLSSENGAVMSAICFCFLDLEFWSNL
uniref:GATA-type domain-containing protein n=1 Tax=Nelumbo nucifera TaxID=4432 RepID=A0A822Z8R6_NELNU|nr:TPA_asm: hypothetical protein HUJ06_014404 [Nelumbo nucifera]